MALPMPLHARRFRKFVLSEVSEYLIALTIYKTKPPKSTRPSNVKNAF